MTTLKLEPLIEKVSMDSLPIKEIKSMIAKITEDEKEEIRQKVKQAKTIEDILNAFIEVLGVKKCQ